MTIASEISRLQTAKTDIKSSIEGKGVTVPSSAKLDSYDDYIDLIEQKGYDGPYPYGNPVYSAMQGPAPSGFHVPLNTEWQAVYDIWTALGGGSSDGPNFGITLKMPFAGNRSNSNSNVANQGTLGHYWSSSRFDEGKAYLLRLGSSSLAPQFSAGRAGGFSIRCFKDSNIIPTSSWTKLYGTSIEAGGIFWNSTDGLISLSSDGQTWITIADKNLGATTVWNSGDTLSEANCGKYYQRGNNYGFPRSGSVTKSSSQVDASNFGPGNYYSNSIFITKNGTPYRWDTTDNGNLWGGETGIQFEGEYVIINNKDYISYYLTKEDMLTSDISSLISELNYNPTYYYTLLTSGSYPKLVSVYKDSTLSDRISLIGSGGAYLSCYDWNTNSYVGGMSQGLKTGSFVQYENGEFKLCTSWYNSNAIL